jgi:GT2 family glycosyltransferase
VTLTAVVVHRRRPRACERTVAGLRAQGVDRAVVVDNGSEELPQVEDVLALGANTGFGPGANAGLRRWLDGGEGEWCLVCPHDAELEDGCVERLLAAVADRPRAGLACAEFGDHEWAGTPVVDPLFGALLRPSTVRSGWEDADYPHGTLMLLRRACLEEVGLFDERYFAYCEEADLGIRARAAGWEVGIVRGAVVRNPGQSSGSGVPGYLTTRNTLWLVRWHFGLDKALAQLVLVAWVTARAALGGPKPPFWHHRARWLAMRDFLLGRVGPPPAI